MRTSIPEKNGVSVLGTSRLHGLTEKRMKISTSPGELREGLFGQIFLYIMEILPALYEEHIFPDWDIRSLRYGAPPEYRVIPGVVEVNYHVDGSHYPRVRFDEVRRRYARVLGDDWDYMNLLWTTYFRIPDRIVEMADEFGDLGHTLGLHFCATDEEPGATGTNPVSHNDMLVLTSDFLDSHPEVESIFVATDEPSFAREVEESFLDKQVMHTVDTAPHRDESDESENPKRADQAMLDCLLLSRCRYVIKCQSALSGFAKVLEPRLQAYRISANKMAVNVPYFPDAYLPKLPTDDPECEGILERLFAGDWLEARWSRKRYGRPFRTMERPKVRPLGRILQRLRG